MSFSRFHEAFKACFEGLLLHDQLMLPLVFVIESVVTSLFDRNSLLRNNGGKFRLVSLLFKLSLI